MRLIAFFFALSLLGALAQSGCNSAEQKNKNTAPATAATPAAPAPDGVRRVTTAELKDLLDRNEAVVIDVRNEASYNAGHIRGSKLIPEAEVVNHVNELPKNKLIVTYCS
jgi:3-mercaptopyruvate sulfurtransferase SseA